MPELDADRLNVADTLRRALAIENELSRPQARAYVRCLQTTWHVPTIQWSERESARQLADARRLLHAAHIFREIEGTSSPRAIDCYRRTGEILEWLSRAADGIRAVVPIELLAAAAYQLGGLPAMASGLLRQVETDHRGVALYSAFLRADFDGVIHRSVAFWNTHPDLTTPDAALRLATAGVEEFDLEEDDNRIAWFFTVELVRSLGLIADSLRRGDDVRLEIAMSKLHALDEMATRTFSDDASLVIALMRQVADGYRAASIYRPLRTLAALNPARTEIAPLSTAEFRNLAGRAGRPGAAKGIEGMTLVALPMQVSSTAPATIPVQRSQLRELQTDYDRQALLRRWADVLGWWMHEPDAAAPEADDLRTWQRFVADNLEFRLGVAIGAVVAQAWSAGAADAFAVPSLADWKATTGLPWFGFWARELLRWGTHDPFVAFALSQNLAQTREGAAARRQEFEAWLNDGFDDIESEDLIDPRLFLQWQGTLARRAQDGAANQPEPAALTGTDGRRQRYNVVPIADGALVRWLDPAGFELARSEDILGEFEDRGISNDYELRTGRRGSAVYRVFSAGSRA